MLKMPRCGQQVVCVLNRSVVEFFHRAPFGMIRIAQHGSRKARVLVARSYDDSERVLIHIVLFQRYFVVCITLKKTSDNHPRSHIFVIVVSRVSEAAAHREAHLRASS